MSARLEAARESLYDHREGALTCYDHDTGWCCGCGTHEILVPWREHTARAVTRATDAVMFAPAQLARIVNTTGLSLQTVHEVIRELRTEHG